MDIDGNLGRLGALPLPDLSALDGSVLAQRARAEQRAGASVTALALAAGLGIGILGGMQAPAEPEAPVVAFGPDPALTPLIALGQP
jgi:hypothetical protein